MKIRQKMWVFSLLSFMCVVSKVWADDALPVLQPVTGRAVCHAQPVTLTEGATPLELCITGGNFSHDQYDLKIGGERALHGIDDETTQGIFSAYKNQKIGLNCSPQEVPPNATLDDIEKIAPGYAPDKAKALVDLMKGSAMGVELGRLCTVSVDGKPAMRVQAIFE